MTKIIPDSDPTLTRTDTGPPQIQPTMYAERHQIVRTRAFKSSTHLGITIRWGGPRIRRQGLGQRQVAGPC
jgi:hypothetical protein